MGGKQETASSRKMINVPIKIVDSDKNLEAKLKTDPTSKKVCIEHINHGYVICLIKEPIVDACEKRSSRSVPIIVQTSDKRQPQPAKTPIVTKISFQVCAALSYSHCMSSIYNILHRSQTMRVRAAVASLRTTICHRLYLPMMACQCLYLPMIIQLMNRFNNCLNTTLVMQPSSLKLFIFS